MCVRELLAAGELLKHCLCFWLFFFLAFFLLICFQLMQPSGSLNDVLVSLQALVHFFGGFFLF